MSFQSASNLMSVVAAICSFVYNKEKKDTRVSVLVLLYYCIMFRSERLLLHVPYVHLMLI